MDLDGLPPVITVAHAGTILGMSRSAAYRAADRGELPTMRFGRRLMVSTSRLRALVGADLGVTYMEESRRRPPDERGIH